MVLSSFNPGDELIVDEDTRNGFVESGFVRYMIVVFKEQLPYDVVIWCFEHGTYIPHFLMTDCSRV